MAAPDAPTVVGIPISVTREPQLLAAVRDAVEARRPTVFVGLYASLFRLLARDPEYRALVAASVTYPDGAGVVRELHKRGFRDAARLATTDVVHPLVRLASSRAWRVGLYGAAPGVAQRAGQALAATAPGLDIAAMWDGFGAGPSGADLRAARLDVLFVGLGAPKQERWAYDVATGSGVPAVLTCGGLFDFLAGDRRRAPRWVQRVGFEWLFRVALEPRRLVKRYLLGNAYFLRAARAERRQGLHS